MESRSIIQYGLVGVGGYLIYLLLLAAMVEKLNYDPVIASILSFIPVLIISYWLSHRWVFRSKRDHRTASIRYLVVTGIGFLLNISIMYVTTHLLDWWYMYSQIVIFVSVAANNYLLNNYWTFGSSSND